MIKFVKGDAVKLIDPNSSLFHKLDADGWKRADAPVAAPATKPKKDDK